MSIELKFKALRQLVDEIEALYREGANKMQTLQKKQNPINVGLTTTEDIKKQKEILENSPEDTESA